MGPVKLCKRGHERTPENTTKSRQCKECKKEWNRTHNKTEAGREYYRNRNKGNAKHKAYVAAWRDNNKEFHKQLISEWSLRNPGKIKGYVLKKLELLPDYIVANALRMNLTTATPELITLKRQQLKLTRFVRKARKLKENENGNIPHNA